MVLTYFLHIFSENGQFQEEDSSFGRLGKMPKSSKKTREGKGQPEGQHCSQIGEIFFAQSVSQFCCGLVCVHFVCRCK